MCQLTPPGGQSPGIPRSCVGSKRQNLFRWMIGVTGDTFPRGHTCGIPPQAGAPSQPASTAAFPIIVRTQKRPASRFGEAPYNFHTTISGLDMFRNQNVVSSKAQHISHYESNMYISGPFRSCKKTWNLIGSRFRNVSSALDLFR